MTSVPDRPAERDAADSAADAKPEGPRPNLSARELQEKVDAPPGSDADQAAEVPHVG